MSTLFRKIIVPVNLERHQETPAIRLSIELAFKCQAEVTLATVIEDLPRYSIIASQKRAYHLQDLLVKEAEDKLATLLRRAREQFPAMQATLLKGHVVTKLMDEINRGGFDLVLKDRDVDGGASRLDARLLRKSDIPVWIVDPAHAQPQRILAAIDPEPDDEERNAICKRILDTALAIGGLFNNPVHVLRAWTPFKQSAAMMHFPQYAFHEYRLDTERTLRQVFEHFLHQYPSHAIVPHFVEGEADAKIREFSRTQNIDVIVMGTLAKPPIANYVIGTTAERVLENQTRSVVAVKPPFKA